MQPLSYSSKHRPFGRYCFRSQLTLPKGLPSQSIRTLSRKSRILSTHTGDILESSLTVDKSQKKGKELQPVEAFRFWHDEKRFKGNGENSVVQQALLAMGGIKVGGAAKEAPLAGPLGWQVPGKWDVLWSPASTARKALSGLVPPALACVVPGSTSLTKKRLLPITLRQAYGEHAWNLVPVTYEVPAAFQDLRVAVSRDVAIFKASQAANSQRASAVTSTTTDTVNRATVSQHTTTTDDTPGQQHLPAAAAATEVEPTAAASSSPDEQPPAAVATADTSTSNQSSNQPLPLWVLKTAQHLALGLAVVPANAVLGTILQRAAAFRDAGRTRHGPRPFVLAQRYIPNPMIIHDRKFGLRLWVVITSADPLRAYIHRNGLVLFSTAEYDVSNVVGEDGKPAPGHITNYAQNVDGMVWSLSQLAAHMGGPAFKAMYRNVLRNVAYTMAAGAKDMQEGMAKLQLNSKSCFELLGLDYLIDTQGHAWLLEVNATPSLAVEHKDPQVCDIIHEQKMGMVKDMFSLLRLTERFSWPAEAALKKPLSSHAQDALHTNGQPASPMTNDVSPHHYWGLDEWTVRAVEDFCHEAGLDEGTAKSIMEAESEMQLCNGFLPLMPIMPSQDMIVRNGWNVALGPADVAVADWCRVRRKVVEESKMAKVSA